MVGIAQLVEHLVVVQGAAGSSPVTHPNAYKTPEKLSQGFLRWTANGTMPLDQLVGSNC